MSEIGDATAFVEEECLAMLRLIVEFLCVYILYC